MDRRKEIEQLRTVLNECRGYFEQRADTTDYSDETGHTPNEEMRLMQEINEVLPLAACPVCHDRGWAASGDSDPMDCPRCEKFAHGALK